VAIQIVTFDESTKTAVDAARAVGGQVGQIVKSLVFVNAATSTEFYLALVSGANRVDLQRLAEALGVISVRRATADEAYAATCFAIGGIPPFGHCKPVQTVMDPDLLAYETVWAAAGTGNTVFEIAPATLRDLAGATLVAVAETADEVGAR